MRKYRFPPEIRQQQILDVAQELFAASSYEQVTIKAIAAAVGISDQAVYQYFPSKDAIYQGLVERYRASRKVVVTYDIVDGSATKTLEAVWDDTISGRYLEKYANYTLSQAIEHRRGAENVRDKAHEGGSDVISNTFLPIIIFGRSTGEFRKDVPAYELAKLVWMWQYTAISYARKAYPDIVSPPDFSLCLDALRPQTANPDE